MPPTTRNWTSRRRSAANSSAERSSGSSGLLTAAKDGPATALALDLARELKHLLARERLAVLAPGRLLVLRVPTSTGVDELAELIQRVEGADHFACHPYRMLRPGVGGSRCAEYVSRRTDPRGSRPHVHQRAIHQSDGCGWSDRCDDPR